MMIKYRLIKETPKMFFLLVRFNMNDLPTFFKLLTTKFVSQKLIISENTSLISLARLFFPTAFILVSTSFDLSLSPVP